MEPADETRKHWASLLAGNGPAGQALDWWLGLAASMLAGGWFTSFFVVDVLDFHINPPRNNSSITFMGAALGRVWPSASTVTLPLLHCSKNIGTTLPRLPTTLP